MAAMRKGGRDRPSLLAALYVSGVALWFVPTLWLLEGYALAVLAVMAWSAVAAVVVHRRRKRAVVALTLGLIGAVNIGLLVAAAAWVPLGMIP
jgi:hypothetical protein